MPVINFRPLKLSRGHILFSLLLCKSILFIEIILKRISRPSRCFLFTRITGGTNVAEELKIQIYYKQHSPLEQSSVSIYDFLI